jgi:hypothetical protein
LLGSQKQFSSKIDWQVDFKNGYQWDGREYYYNSYKHLDYQKKGIQADILIPWELSRFQHLFTLGKAYWYTDNPKYVQEFVEEIETWLESNPLHFGINWISSMEVSIRAINWIAGYYFFCNSSILTEEFKNKFFKSLYSHGRFILDRVANGNPNNHYLTGLAGLLVLGLLFQDTPEGGKWLDKSVKCLEEEIYNQFYEDGVNMESSTDYNIYSVEIFLFCSLIYQRNGKKFSHRFHQQLEKIVDFIPYIVKPDGNLLTVGDIANTQLFKMGKYEDAPGINSLFCSAAHLLNREDLLKYSNIDEESFWLLGYDLNYKFAELSYEVFRKLESHAFQDGGYYVMRDDDHYMAIYTGSPEPKGSNGHRHNDALSFELYAPDKSFIVDPGSYVYTEDPDMRNMFRSSRYHNKVVVDNMEENHLHNNSVFKIDLESHVKPGTFISNNDYDYFKGELTGYGRIKPPISQEREVYFDKKDKYWILMDTVFGEGKHQLDQYFHFAPLSVVNLDEEHLVVITDEEDGNLAVIPLDSGGLEVDIIEGWVSTSYGEKKSAPILMYSKYSKLPAHFCTLLLPFKNRKDLEHPINNREIFLERFKKVKKKVR